MNQRGIMSLPRILAFALTAFSLTTGCGRGGSTPPDGSGSRDAAPTPESGHCSVICSGAPGSCETNTWNFESGTVEGFDLNFRVARPADRLSPTTDIVHSGAYAVTAALSITKENFIVEVRRHLCEPGLIADLRGKIVRAWVYLDGPVLPQETTCDITFSGFSRWATGHTRGIVGRWFELSGRWADDLSPGWMLTPLAIEVACNFERDSSILGPKDPDPSWQGNIYVDDVTIE